MPHMVVFRSSEGKPGYHQVDTLDEAVRFVEHLRNNEQVTEARIFRLKEVPIEFRAYYKVEVGTGSPEPGPSTRPDEEPARPGTTADPPVVVEPAVAAAASGSPANRFARFTRP